MINLKLKIEIWNIFSNEIKFVNVDLKFLSNFGTANYSERIRNIVGYKTKFVKLILLCKLKDTKLSYLPNPSARAAYETRSIF